MALAGPKQIVLAGRSRAKISPVIEAVNKVDQSIKVDFVQLDLANLQSVQQAGDEINKITDRIDVLINNAGIMALEKHTLNDAGVEMHMATNHFGHFYLTSLLSHKLAASAPSRVINLSSNAYALSPIRFDDMNFSDSTYNPWLAYGQSKTANALFSLMLAKKLERQGVAVYTVNPGLILETHLQDAVSPDMFRAGGELYQKIYAERGKPIPDMPVPKPLAAGSATTLVAALDPDIVSGNGGFLSDCQFDGGIEEHGKSLEDAEKLWIISEKATGAKFSV